MYIHLGQDTVISSKQIVGIFDIENTSISKHTKAFFADNEKMLAIQKYSLDKQYRTKVYSGKKPSVKSLREELSHL